MASIGYERALPTVDQVQPWRKPTSYLVKDENTPLGWREVKGERRPSNLFLINGIRERVDAWREQGYPGASSTTRRLLQYWFEDEHLVPNFDPPFRYYFCQREAIETLIWLMEIRDYSDVRSTILDCAGPRTGGEWSVGTKMDGIARLRRRRLETGSEVEQDLPVDGLRRYAFKMATGSGKTWVMAMAMVWSYLCRVVENNTSLATNSLLVAPNIVVYQRLERDFANGRIFRQLPLVPPELRSEFHPSIVLRNEELLASGNGCVVVTNIQQLYLRTEQGGPVNPASFLIGSNQVHGESRRREMLQQLCELGNLLVLNDEAHHVHDEDLSWNKALQEIHEAMPSGLSAWLDFSATPKDQSGIYFPWTVVDYPLAQAVEDRIVKVPVVVSVESSRGKPLAEPSNIIAKNVVSKYRWWIRSAVKRWKEYEKLYDELGKRAVLFIMAERNAYADKIGEHLTSTREYGLSESEVLVIHTDNTGEVRKGDVDKARQAARDIDEETSKVRVIVSVMMLREGWDVRGVSVVLGLRPFTAKANILPEQVIGRGLRLMSGISPDQTQILEVFGTDRLLNTLKQQLEIEGVSAVEVKRPLSVPVLVQPMLERSQHDISLPITKPQFSQVQDKLAEVDVSEVEPLLSLEKLEAGNGFLLRMYHTPTEVEVHNEELTESDILPVQDPLADIALDLSHHLRLPRSFARLYNLVRQYVTNRCFGGTVDAKDSDIQVCISRPDVREQIAAHLAKHIFDKVSESGEMEFVDERHLLSSTRPFFWRRDLPPLEATKTIFNYVATYNAFERQFAEFLDRAPDVLRFAALGTTEQGNSGSVFRINYMKDSGALGFYYPDWVVVQRCEGTEIGWIIETKGRVWEDTEAKDVAMERWCERITELTGQRWRYKRINQGEFRPREFTQLADIV